MIETIYTHDAEGRILSIADRTQGGSTKTETRTLDAQGRIIQVTDRNGHVRKYSCNAADQRLTETDHSNGVTTHAYDARRRLASTTAPGLGETSYRYDGADRLLTSTYANLSVATRVYDAAGQLTSLTHTRAGGTLRSQSFIFDANGNRTRLDESDGTAIQTTTYTYDNADRLIGEANPNKRTLDTLDAAGNRTKRIVQDGAGVLQQTINSTINARDQITQIETRNAANAVLSTQTLQYDLDGNRTSITSGGSTTQSTFDRRGRALSSIFLDGTWNDVRLLKQISQQPCIKDVNWRYANGVLTTEQRCRAEFAVLE